MKNTPIKSADGCLSVNPEGIQKVCMTGSTYALLQYLLLFDTETVTAHTFYFLGYAVSPSIASHLPARHISLRQTSSRIAPQRWVGKIMLKLGRNLRHPFLRNAEIYAFDQGFVSPLIGRRDYSLLSDGPRCMSLNMQETSAEYQRQLQKRASLPGRLEQLLFGPVATHPYGNNPQCRQFFMTEENESPVFGSRPVHVRSLQTLWDEAAEEKRELIRKVFDIDDADIATLNSRKVIFLTQPLTLDCGLTEEEYLGILRKIFSHYDHSQLLLKLHPRDRFDYQRHFPQVAVYGKNVNMQLLVLLGTRVERAATVCSSAINAFPDSVQADWFGPGLHPKLLAFYGTTMRPDRPCNQM